MATHSSTLAWKTPWMEEPGRLQSVGLQRVGHDWATSPHLSDLILYFLAYLGRLYLSQNVWMPLRKCTLEERSCSFFFKPTFTSLMAESKEELKSLLKMKEENEKAGLTLNIQKTKVMASGPITSGQIDGETVETVTDFILGGSKITADGDCSHEIKRCLLLGSKAMTNLDSILKSRDYFADKGSSSQSYVFFSSMETSIQSCMDVRVGL